jgi:hypothetical protein
MTITELLGNVILLGVVKVRTETALTMMRLGVFHRRSST